MADKVYFVQTPDREVLGFRTASEAADWAQRGQGVILDDEAAAPHLLKYEAQGVEGALTSGAVEAGFGIPKALIGAFGSKELKAKVAAAQAAHPLAGIAGSFIAPWGAAGKVAGGLFGLGEAAEAASVFGKAGSIFSEGSALEGAAARGAEGLAGRAVGATEARALSPVFDHAASLARPGVAGEFEGLAGRALTPEGRAIVEAHPRSFLEAALREGSVGAGAGAINSAGDYLLTEKYMDGTPREDAGSLVESILGGALTGGLLGGAAGVVTHGASRASDALLNPANAPKMRIPAALQGELEASLRKGGMSAEEASRVAKNAIEHGVAGTSSDASTYNALSAHLENARVKRGLERGEFQLPPSMAGETALKDFVEQVTERAHAVRRGAELPSTLDAIRGVESEVAQAAGERRAALIGEARQAPSPEAAKVWINAPYKGELKASAAEAELLEGKETARLLDKADALLAKNPTSRVARIQAMTLLEQAQAAAPSGFTLDAERGLLGAPLSHEANGNKFLSALGEHQLAEKARRDVGALVEQASAGGHLANETVVSAEQGLKGLGLEGGRLDKAVVEHYTNEAAKAVGAEAKQIDPTLRMLGGFMAGGLAHKVLGGFTGGYLGMKIGQGMAQAAADPIAASGAIRKVMASLNYGARDLERIVQGLPAEAAPKASLVNLAENVTPWGKVLWDTAPGKTARMVGQTLENAFQSMASAMPQRAAAGMQVAQSIEQHLAKYEPKPVIPINVNPAAVANLPPRYNEREVASYQTRLQATVAPKGVIEKFVRTGELSKEAADTLRATHPSMVQQIVAKGAERMAQLPEAARYGLARRLEVLGGTQAGYFSPSTTPAFVAAVQKGYAAMGPQGPGPGGPSGNASPQKDPGSGGAQFAPATAMRGNETSQFLHSTHAAPSAALGTSLGSK